MASLTAVQVLRHRSFQIHGASNIEDEDVKEYNSQARLFEFDEEV